MMETDCVYYSIYKTNSKIFFVKQQVPCYLILFRLTPSKHQNSKISNLLELGIVWGILGNCWASSSLHSKVSYQNLLVFTTKILITLTKPLPFFKKSKTIEYSLSLSLFMKICYFHKTFHIISTTTKTYIFFLIYEMHIFINL